MAQTVANAQALAASLAERGASIVSGGTDNHLMLVDVRPLGVNGKEADAALGEVRITVNKNTIPYDPNPPMVGSGIRVGTPAVTGRGMHEAEMRAVAGLIVDGIAARGDEAAQERVRAGVAEIVDRFPVPGLPGPHRRAGRTRVIRRARAGCAALASDERVPSALGFTARAAVREGPALRSPGSGSPAILAASDRCESNRTWHS